MTHYIVKKMKGVALLATLLIIITQTGCNSNSDIEPVTQDNYFLDTTCSVSVYQIDGGLDEDKANAAITKAYDRCRELDKLLSNNLLALGIYDQVNALLEEAGRSLADIEEAEPEPALGNGAFDITIGRVTDLWDFHAEKPKLPDEAKLQEALRHVDYRNVEVDGNRIRLLDPEAKIDLGGIAKGYVGDEMRKVLKKEGVTSAVINLGGNIVTVGTKPDGSEYTIGIEKPFSDRQEIIGCTHIGEGTVVTSGIYERQFEYKGKRYHHILSPKTGYPVGTDLEAVSLVTAKNSSMDTDAMSTICLMKGTKAAKKFIDSQKGIEAAFYGKDDKTSTTEGMDFEAE